MLILPLVSFGFILLLALGFMYLNFRAEVFYGALLIYLLNVYISAINVLLDKKLTLQLFLFGLVWTVQTSLVIMALPYEVSGAQTFSMFE
jgi:hypothetical protein